MYLQGYKSNFTSKNSHEPLVNFFPIHDYQAEWFQPLIEYLVMLYEDKSIDSDTFEELIKQIAGNFVEFEVSSRIDRILNKRSVLDKLWSFL